MRKSIIYGLLCIVLSLFVCGGCKYVNHDREQIYHEGFEEYEHAINDELGDYITIDRYQDLEDEGRLNILVYFQHSYYSDDNMVRNLPLWLIVDRFRCISNDYIRDNGDCWAYRYDRINCTFYIDEGRVPETIASISNYVCGFDSYDLFITENLGLNVDYGQLEDRQDIRFIYLNYSEKNENPTLEDCYEFYCEQIDLFPNLEYVFIYVPSHEIDEQELMQMIHDKYEDLISLN